MTKIERHLLFDIWINRTLSGIGVTSDRYVTNHFQFKSGERLVTLLFSDLSSLKAFKKSKGTHLVQQASKSTGIYTLIGYQCPVTISSDLLRKIPEGLSQLTSIDVLQGAMYGNQKSPGGILNQLIPFDLFE
jgi:hypothetical protein